ncbi:hypothetical protein [Colwellia chukchiensis]|nr:hypothetical protein [Colwellia chukchiensis]
MSFNKAEPLIFDRAESVSNQAKHTGKNESTTQAKTQNKHSVSGQTMPPTKVGLANSELIKQQNQQALTKHTGLALTANTTDALVSNDALTEALKAVPINYHSVLHWRGRQNDDLINAYSTVVAHDELSAAQAAPENIASLMSDFIYQHELSIEIVIEYLNCNQQGCIIYGVETQSGVWSQLMAYAQMQPWWQSAQENTQSGVGADGQLIFFTVIRR